MKKRFLFIFSFLILFGDSYIHSAGSSGYDFIPLNLILSNLTISNNLTATGKITLGGILTNLDGTYAVTQSVATPGYAAFIVGSVANYTVAQATNGAGADMFFSNVDGWHVWNNHVNLSILAVGAEAYVNGLHGPDQSGLFILVDSTNSKPINIYQNASTDVSPLISLHAETPFQNSLYPGGPTPAYSGSQVGPAISYQKRDINQFVVDSSGTVFSYNTAGTSYIAMYNNTASGIIQTVAGVPISYLSATGSNVFYSASLLKTATLSVDSTGDSTMTATSDMWISSANVTGRFTQPSFALAQLKVKTPRFVGEKYYCSDCSNTLECTSTGTVNAYSFAASQAANRTTVCQ